ncbi:MAG: cobyrinate a,c-diamide synthase [bacterium]
MTSGLIISAPASGTGKTTLTLGLARAFRNRGLQVQTFKSGPDYIDPAFHRAATGRASYNLDTWAMGQGLIGSLLTHAIGADLVIAEGSMGLHDGVAIAGELGTGASADLALLTGWPVIVVIDVSGQAQTAAATAAGLAAFRPGLPFAGVVLNRVASPRHERLVRLGMAQAGITVLGALPRNPTVVMPERHLGLVQAEELPDLEPLLDEAARFIVAHVDLDAVQAAALPTVFPLAAHKVRPPAQRIALARDTAFSFIYPHLLDGWRAAGAEILPFSPLADQAPDPTADICWLPGGYPELHAGRIANAWNFKKSLQAFAKTKQIHGECGGYMVLGTGLTDKQGHRHDMTGLLGLETSFHSRKMHLGYRIADLIAPIPGHAPGNRLRGHEFHYTTILSQPDRLLARVTDAEGNAVPETGSQRGHVTGSFFHLIAEAT